MTNSSAHHTGLIGLALLLASLAMPAAAHYARTPTASLPAAAAVHAARNPRSGWYAGRASGSMRVGLTLVGEQGEKTLPDPAGLGYPATPRAIRCESGARGYRECRTPFRGPVTLAREVSDTRCVEDHNWGWREGTVWVDRGCAAVFVRIGDA